MRNYKQANCRCRAKKALTGQKQTKREYHIVTVFFIAFFAVIVLRSAWLSDDAYITFRTVDNFINGYGLRWNIAERVQSYTNPLWMFCVSLMYYFSREVYYSVLLFSLAVSLTTIALLGFHIARERINIITAIMILAFSKAFVDYSTSGLENPLTHLMLALFFLQYYRFEQSLPEHHTCTRIFLLSFTASLGVLNRMDTLLFFAPPLAYVLLRNSVTRSKISIPYSKIGIALAGFFPFILWELFSLFYYGFPFPNTAYAKLNTGVHRTELFEQGFYYLLNSLSRDPLTLFTISAVVLYVILFAFRNRYHLFAGIGILLYMIYIVRIGGDFMSGRFLAAPLLCAVIVLSRLPLKPLTQGIPMLMLIVLVGLHAPDPLSTIESSDEYNVQEFGKWWDHRGISDERAFYYPWTGLLRANRTQPVPDTFYRIGYAKKAIRSGKRVVVNGVIGFFGFYAGPTLHIIDEHALSDPLLARLPILSHKGGWRIGHFKRDIPEGYAKTAVGENVILDPDLAQYWEKLSLVSRGKLFSWGRLREIWNFNTGKYDALIQEYCKKYQFIKHPQIRIVKEEGTPWNAPGNYLLNQYGLGIMRPRIELPEGDFSVSLNGGERYRIAYYRRGRQVAEQKIDIPTLPSRGLAIYRGVIPQEAIQQQFDLLRVMPGSKPGKHSVGHFRIEFPPIVKKFSEMSEEQEQGTFWSKEGNVVLNDKDLLIELEKTYYGKTIEISADCNDRYRITYFLDKTKVGELIVPEKIIAQGGLTTRDLDVPVEAVIQGYNRLLITPIKGDGLYSVGHVSL